jgi:hypothetical protein
LVLADAGTSRLGGNAQGGGQFAIIDLGVFRAEHRARELARQVRLASSCLRRRNPLQGQPELLLEYKLMAQPCLVVRRQCDDQRPFRAQSHIHAGRLLQFGGESGPPRLAGATERDQRLFARLGLGAGSKHPRSRMARASTARALVEHRNRYAAHGQPPRNAKADDAGTDNGDVGLANIACWAIRHPAAPFAGMTQTGSLGLISAASPRHPRP